MAKEPAILKDKSQPRAIGSQALFIKRHRLAIYCEPAAVGGKQSPQDAQQCGLAATRRPDDGQCTNLSLIGDVSEHWHAVK